MGYTRVDARNKIRFFLNEQTESFWLDADINTAINDAGKEVSKEIRFPRTNFSSALTSGQYQVNLSTNWTFINQDKGVFYVSRNYSGDFADAIELHPSTVADIGQEEVENATPSTPEKYYPLTETTIGVYPPIAETSGTSYSGYVKCYLVVPPTVMDTDGETSEILDWTFYAHVYHATAECFGKREGFEEKQILYDNKYQNEVAKIKSDYSDKFGVDPHIKPHDDYIDYIDIL